MIARARNVQLRSFFRSLVDKTEEMEDREWKENRGDCEER